MGLTPRTRRRLRYAGWISIRLYEHLIPRVDGADAWFSALRFLKSPMGLL